MSAPPLTVAFVTSARLWAGVKVWMLEFGAALQAQGDRVHVFARDERLVAEARRLGLGAEAVRFGPDFNPWRTAWFWRRFGALGVDAVVGNLYKELGIAGVAAHLRGIPVVHRAGLVGDISTRRANRWLHHHVVNQVLVPSHQMRSELLERHPWLATPGIRAIHNGREPAAEPHAARQHPLRLVMTSRLERDKGQLDLVEALARLRARGQTSLTCDIYGEGALRPTLQARIAKEGLAEQVSLSGFAEDLPARLPAYDAGVLASGREGMPNTLLEFLAAGLPVVSTRVSGVAEVLAESPAGLLYDYGDCTTLAEHLATLAGMDDAAYAKRSAAALEIVRTRLNRAARARELHDFLAALAAARRGHRPDA